MNREREKKRNAKALLFRQTKRNETQVYFLLCVLSFFLSNFDFTSFSLPTLLFIPTVSLSYTTHRQSALILYVFTPKCERVYKVDGEYNVANLREKVLRHGTKALLLSSIFCTQYTHTLYTANSVMQRVLSKMRLGKRCKSSIR